jgi:lysozyme
VIKDLNQAWPGLSLLQCARHDACINMAFQLGINGFLQFRMMRQALNRCNWLEARNEALDSLWARQTPNRARRVAEQILTGEYYEIP